MRIVQCGLHWACVERGGKVLDGKTIDGIFLDLYLASVLLSYKQYRTHNLIKESESAYVCRPIHNTSSRRLPLTAMHTTRALFNPNIKWQFPWSPIVGSLNLSLLVATTVTVIHIHRLMAPCAAVLLLRSTLGHLVFLLVFQIELFKPPLEAIDL